MCRVKTRKAKTRAASVDVHQAEAAALLAAERWRASPRAALTRGCDPRVPPCARPHVAGPGGTAPFCPVSYRAAIPSDGAGCLGRRCRVVLGMWWGFPFKALSWSSGRRKRPLEL